MSFNLRNHCLLDLKDFPQRAIRCLLGLAAELKDSDAAVFTKTENRTHTVKAVSATMLP